MVILEPDMSDTLALLDSLLSTFEGHARDHDKHEEEERAGIACSDDSGPTQRQGDCVDVLSALPVVFHKLGSDACALPPEESAMYYQLSSKLCQFIGILLEGRACPHSNYVFGFGQPSQVEWALHSLFSVLISLFSLQVYGFLCFLTSCGCDRGPAPAVATVNEGLALSAARLAQLVLHFDISAFMVLFSDMCQLLQHALLMLEVGKVRRAACR